MTTMRKKRQPPKRTVRPKKKTPTKAELLKEAEPLVEELADVRKAKGDLSEREKELQESILKVFDKTKQKSAKIAGLHVTRVQSSSLVIDEPKLKKRLGAALWNKVSTRSLDRKKLDAHIASGEVKTSDLAACSDEKQNRPYIKIT